MRDSYQMRLSRGSRGTSNLPFIGLLHAESLHSELDIEQEQSPRDEDDLLPELLPFEEPKPTKTIRQTAWRWFALSLTCLVNFALYYCYHLPQALQPPIEEKYGLNDVQFNILYSIYSLPNIILPFIGGVLIDHLGVRIAMNLFGFILIIGQGLFTYGAYIENFSVMVLGRFVFGLGGESLAVSQLPMVSKWFSMEELSFAWGFGRAAIRVGSSLNGFFTPKIYAWTGSVYMPLLVATIVTIVSWLCGLVLGYMDRLAEKQEGDLGLPHVQKEKFHFRDLKLLPFLVGLLLLNYCCLYGSLFAFSNNVSNLLVKRFGFSIIQAGNLVMIIYLGAAFIGLFFGKLLDRHGKRIRVLIIASMFFLASELLVVFLSDGTSENPNYGVVAALLGISLFYSVYSTVFFPCLPLLVEKRMLGTVTGMITASLNLTLTLYPLVLGVIHDKTEDVQHGYFWTEITLACSIGLGVLVSIWIYEVDAKHGKKLDKTPLERRNEVKERPSLRSQEEREALKKRT